MSATGADPPGGNPFDTGAAHRYFRELEDAFIELRGAPLELSPADWQVAKRWYERGIPLDHVRKVLAEVLTRRRERGAEGFVTLRYCRRAVESSWRAVEALRAPGEREVVDAVDVGARLAALAAALPATLPDRAALAARILALAGDTESVEAALAGLDREILARQEAALSPAERREVEARVEETVAGLFGHLFAGDVDRARDRLRRQVLRRHLGLPVLSLFSPEAEAGEGDDGGDRAL
jgi:hypothetical protein